MTAVGRVAGIENLCSTKLRSLIETENMISPVSDAQKLVSQHLGHSERMRDETYILPDRRWWIQAANRLQFLLEEAGESDDGAWREEPICKNTELVKHQLYRL